MDALLGVPLPPMRFRSPQTMISLLAMISLHGNVAAESHRGVYSIQQEIDTLSAEAKSLPELLLNPTPWTLGFKSRSNQPIDAKIQLHLKFVTPATIDLVALLPTSYTSNAGEVAA